MSNPSDGVNVGFTTGTPTATLAVNGWDITNQTVNQFDTYGTFTNAGSIENETRWRLHRVSDANGTPREIGRLYALAGTVGALNNGFHIRQMEANAALWLRNQSNNGIRLIDDVTTTINGYTNLNTRQGYMAVGRINALPGGTVNAMSAIDAPWSRVHLVHQAGPDAPEGWRPHMRNGTVMSGNSDLAYFGQMFDMGSTGTGAEVDDQSNTLIAWGSTTLPVGAHSWDNCTFRFSTEPGVLAGSSSSVRGLELLRLRPYRAATNAALEGFVGLGDWAAGTDLPQERLDVLNGRVRFRSLPDAGGEATGNYEVMVVDNSASPSGERGVVKWVDPSVLTGATDCDWETDASNKDVTTAWETLGSNGSCPEADWLVGIGTDAPRNKLEVYHNEGNVSLTGGMLVEFDSDQEGWAYGIRSIVKPISDPTDYGIGIFSRYVNPGTSAMASFSRLEISDASVNPGSVYGSKGMVDLTDGSASRAYGTYGEIQVVGAQVGAAFGAYGWVHAADATINESYGVFGSAQHGASNYSVFGANPGSGANDWSGYFPGKTLVGGTTFTPSDEQLKTNIEEVAGASELLLSLNPRKYQYLSDQYPQLGLAQGDRYGFMAQEVQAVFPQFVTPVHHPLQTDSAGNVISEAVDFLGLSTSEFIPLLVAGFKEQHQVIGQLQAQLAQMQEQLAACCASTTDSDLRNGSIGTGSEEEKLTPAQERLLRIAPNPFTDRTTLYCDLERAGRMQLLANSSDGRELMVLAEGQREAGEFQQVWSTENLAPGVYYITLLLDGEPVVKRAVKVGR